MLTFCPNWCIIILKLNKLKYSLSYCAWEFNMLQRCNILFVLSGFQPDNIKQGTKMQKNTKKYLENLIWEIEVDVNVIELEVSEVQKNLKKLRQFYNRVIKQL